ncbi:MAG TPA: ATP-binding protein [Actinomycetota bacterium]|nr:ATP-binding protein [Actinomycetota bacterium]
MNDVHILLAEQYREALETYLTSADESGLWRAYDLGRQSLQSGIGVLDLVLLHRRVLDRRFEDPVTPAQVIRLVDVEGAADFLLEALAPYEMAQRVLQEETDDLLRRTERAQEASTRHQRALGRALAAVDRLEQERRRLAADLVDAEEKERQRIAAEVHDDSLQVLSALDLRIQTLVRAEGDGERRGALESAQEIVRLASDRLRCLVFDLRPPELDRVGLGVVLRASLERLSAESGIEIDLQDEMESPPPPDSGIVLYRIAQEALANVRRHAHAGTAVVTLSQQDGGFLLQVRDDGRGFDPAERAGQSSKHFGLTVMRERAETVGGWIRVESLPGKGTVVEAWVPGQEWTKDGPGTTPGSEGPR